LLLAVIETARDDALMKTQDAHKYRADAMSFFFDGRYKTYCEKLDLDPGTLPEGI
jgi:hypothetical protein